jgi:NADH:ubiquinone oxidoreductase subunit 2 (subunit N)
VCLELNLLRFVGFLLLWKSTNLRVRLKYFLIQRLGSGLFLVSIFIKFKFLSEVFRGILIVRLCLKLAAAPFYGWVLLLAQELDWFAFFLLRRVQKVLPLFFLLSASHWRLSWVRGLRVLIAAVGSLREASLKKTIAFSSVFGAGWFLARGSFTLALGYLGFYRLRFWVVSQVWSSFNRNELLVFQLRGLSLSGALAIVVSLLNFAGLPPFSLFYFKVSILRRAMRTFRTAHLASLLGAAVVFIYVYLRIGLSQLQLVAESTLCPGSEIKSAGRVLIRLRLSLLFLRLLHVF